MVWPDPHNRSILFMELSDVEVVAAGTHQTKSPYVGPFYLECIGQD